MEEKEDLNWGDTKIFINGKEIVSTVIGIDYGSIDGDYLSCGEFISINGSLTFTGTISFSEKKLKKLQNLFKNLLAKKRRTPRKIKKRLKKTTIDECD